MICAMGVYAGIPVQLSWPSSNIGGATKKGVAIAAVISLSQLGSIIGGQTYRDDDGRWSRHSLSFRTNTQMITLTELYCSF